MSVKEIYNPALDARSSAYLAILEVRDLLYAEGLGHEAEPHVEALVKLVQRTGRPSAPGPGPSLRPSSRFGLRIATAPYHG